MILAGLLCIVSVGYAMQPRLIMPSSLHKSQSVLSYKLEELSDVVRSSAQNFNDFCNYLGSSTASRYSGDTIWKLYENLQNDIVAFQDKIDFDAKSADDSSGSNYTDTSFFYASVVSDVAVASQCEELKSVMVRFFDFFYNNALESAIEMYLFYKPSEEHVALSKSFWQLQEPGDKIFRVRQLIKDKKAELKYLYCALKEINSEWRSFSKQRNTPYGQDLYDEQEENISKRINELEYQLEEVGIQPKPNNVQQAEILVKLDARNLKLLSLKRVDWFSGEENIWDLYYNIEDSFLALRRALDQILMEQVNEDVKRYEAKLYEQVTSFYATKTRGYPNSDKVALKKVLQENKKNIRACYKYNKGHRKVSLVVNARNYADLQVSQGSAASHEDLRKEFGTLKSADSRAKGKQAKYFVVDAPNHTITDTVRYGALVEEEGYLLEAFHRGCNVTGNEEK